MRIKGPSSLLSRYTFLNGKCEVKLSICFASLTKVAIPQYLERIQKATRGLPTLPSDPLPTYSLLHLPLTRMRLATLSSISHSLRPRSRHLGRPHRVHDPPHVLVRKARASHHPRAPDALSLPVVQLRRVRSVGRRCALCQRSGLRTWVRALSHFHLITSS